MGGIPPTWVDVFKKILGCNDAPERRYGYTEGMVASFSTQIHVLSDRLGGLSVVIVHAYENAMPAPSQPKTKERREKKKGRHLQAI
jgi:hypothetical protein